MNEFENKKDNPAIEKALLAENGGVKLDQKPIVTVDKERVNSIKKDIENNKKPKDKKHKKSNKGLKIAVFTLAIFSVSLLSIIGIMIGKSESLNREIENGYISSFVDMTDRVDYMDLNLSKFSASKDSAKQQEYLTDIAINAEVAENDLQSLPLMDESKFLTAKLINQVGDFSKYLKNKIAQGENLSETDIKNVQALSKSVKKLKNSLDKMANNLGGDFSRLTIFLSQDLNLGFNELENMSASFPELIYDGPFSDGNKNREIKGLKGEEISKEKAREKFISYVNFLGQFDPQDSGEIAGKISAYGFTASNNSVSVYGQVSKVGGRLLLLTVSRNVTNMQENSKNKQEKSSDDIAKEFLLSIGLKDMIPVWSAEDNEYLTINYAYSINGVPFYADLVKVKLTRGDFNVVGFEGSDYYINHFDRENLTVNYSEDIARKKLSSDFNVKNSRLVVIPTGETSEEECYEFSGEIGGEDYYIYISAITLKEKKIFKVVTSKNGDLLM